MSTTKFANVKKSSLVILYSLVLTQAWVLRFGEVGTSCLLTARPMLWLMARSNYKLHFTICQSFRYFWGISSQQNSYCMCMSHTSYTGQVPIRILVLEIRGQGEGGPRAQPYSTIWWLPTHLCWHCLSIFIRAEVETKGFLPSSASTQLQPNWGWDSLIFI